MKAQRESSGTNSLILTSTLDRGEGRGLAPNTVPVEKMQGGLQSLLDMFVQCMRRSPATRAPCVINRKHLNMLSL